jgi:class 3 adenylate cyclase
MADVETRLTKCIFSDIVGFTRGRSVEAQSDLVAALNTIVKTALEKNGVTDEHCILLPTGDGIGIALTDLDTLYDVHIQLALDILAGIAGHNAQTEDKMRQFEARIGINQNVDNIVTDINGRPNVAGNGINVAQRVMSMADGNQILVSQVVYEILNSREKYMGCFQRYEGTDKHRNRFPVYQYIRQGHIGLNVNVPSPFAPERRLTPVAAYYIAHALRLKSPLYELRGGSRFSYASRILLYTLALDSIKEANANPFEELVLRAPRVSGTAQLPMDAVAEQYNEYAKLELWVAVEYSGLIGYHVLEPYTQCFTIVNNITRWAFPSPEGAEKLKREWPDIWEKFSLD